MDCAIELRGLEKTLGDFHLGPLDLRVPQGSVVGYIGENGAGKSTTIKLILGLLRPDRGSVRVLGQDAAALTPEARQNIGYVFDDLYLPKAMTVREAGVFHQKLYGAAWDEAQFAALIRNFALPSDKPIESFSRGMKMQLSIALALSHNARLLLLDEATSGLDPVVRDDILDLLLNYLQDERHTIFISSHILTDLEKIADYIAFIHEGQLLFMEEKDALVERYGRASLSDEELSGLRPEAIVGLRHHQFGNDVLLKRELTPPEFRLEKVTIEDIMVFMIKGGTR